MTGLYRTLRIGDIQADNKRILLYYDYSKAALVIHSHHFFELVDCTEVRKAKEISRPMFVESGTTKTNRKSHNRII